MGYQNNKNEAPRLSSGPRLGFTSTGTGISIYKGINDSMVEFNSIKVSGGLDIYSDEETVNIDASKITETISNINTKFNTLSTSLAGFEALTNANYHKLSSNIRRIEDSAYTLPETLSQLADMPKFHGCVPVIENGKWAALNLSASFFSKYEYKIECQTDNIQAIEKLLDITRKEAIELESIVLKLQDQIKRIKSFLFIGLLTIGSIIICSAIFLHAGAQ